LGWHVLRNDDLLLLDEPTNHLDLDALAWLENYLHSFKGGLLVVSHDRQFLNQTVNAIIEIDEHNRQATQYTGNYDSYAATKVQERGRWEAEYAAQQEEIIELRKLLKTKSRQNAFAVPARYRQIRLHLQDQLHLPFTHAAQCRERLRRIEECCHPLSINPSSIRSNHQPSATCAAISQTLR
jgi:ATP-binding cassette subfamily F protein 3